MMISGYLNVGFFFMCLYLTFKSHFYFEIEELVISI